MVCFLLENSNANPYFGINTILKLSSYRRLGINQLAPGQLAPNFYAAAAGFNKS